MELVPADVLYEWQRIQAHLPSWHNCELPPGAKGYLAPSNPKLTDLEDRYRAFDASVTTPFVWTREHIRAEHLLYFRGDNAWVWQKRGKNANILGYALSFYYLQSIDRLGLLNSLPEDNSFGNFTFAIAGLQASRDLLDSIAEIYFLDRNLGISSRSGLRILDIGAGYGRLAHRMSTLSTVEKYYCTDAVASSTFVSDFYLRFRGVEKASVIPLDHIENSLRDNRVDLAINVHSFSECRREAIEWWARLLSKNRVKNLMIVPNRTDPDKRRLLTNDGQDFLTILEDHGYRTAVIEPKFLDPVVQQYGLLPSWHFLLELQQSDGIDAPINCQATTHYTGGRA